MTRGPAPTGATAPRLHSLNADGFHSSAVTKGPIVEDSLFEWMGDDSIAIHGTYALATAASGGEQITLSPKFELPFEVGDDLTIVDGKTYKVKATAKVTKTEPAAASESEAVDKLWETYRVDQKGRKFYTVSIDRPTAIEVGDLITSPQRIGNGYVIRNNTCRFHRARGIQIKAGDGVIENNTVEDINFAGITLGPELSVWLGSDYVKNVVVRNNTIRGTGRGGEGRRNANFADIAAIVVRSLTLDRELSAAENANIVIENNRIENPAGLAMFLSSATNLVVKDNTIVAPWSMGPTVSGKRFGVDPAAAVFVAAVEGATFENNTIDLDGGTATKALATGRDANGLSGVESGFTLKGAAPASAE
ncbi:MAG TPA: right-handed parallel beta-helix repeat-containing protein [Tepidisphaeraceae bacterium]|nr:right-handed parallel beta-helix repeat-containing protein [Tepidisphaeraceae bacterium]